MNEPLAAREAPASYVLEMQRVRQGYKQTEVGVIPEDWEVRFLGNICEKITTGKLDANAMTVDGDYPFFTCAKEHYWIDKYAFDAEALLVSGNGANVGYIHYYYGQFNAYQRTYVLTGFSVDIHFAKLFMERNLQRRLRAEVNAGNTPYIVKDTLAKMRIAVPLDRNEQRAIAAALSDVDALLAKLDQLIAKKRDLKQAAMQQLLTGQTRLPGFSGEWEVVKAGDIGRFRGGSGFPIEFQGAKSGEYPLFKVSDMNNVGNETFMETANNYISEALRKQLGATVFPAESIVFAKVGAAVFLERKKILSRASCLDNNMAAFVMDVNRAHCPFIHYVLLNTKLGNLVSTTALPSLSGGVLAAIEFPLPSLPEQTAIATVLSDMDAEIAALEARRAKARDLKQGMMQELLTGRIRLV